MDRGLQCHRRTREGMKLGTDPMLMDSCDLENLDLVRWALSLFFLFKKLATWNRARFYHAA